MTQADKRLITFISWSGIVVGLVSAIGYLLMGYLLDSLYGLFATISFSVILYLISIHRISYESASVFFSAFGIMIVTLGYITSISVEDGLIYMIVPTIIIALLRPTDEAVKWLIVYYGMFFVINILKIPNYPISVNIFIQFFTIHMLLFVIISYFRNQERRLSRELRIANERLQKEVTLDTLTGAHNRRAFKEIVERAISFHAHTEQPCVLVIIDIDHFKRINDNYGHLKGDMVLKELGRHIRSKIRKGDILIRYGGEEFVICFEQMGLQKAVAIMEEMRQSIEALTLVNGETITVSAGLSALQKGDTPFGLLSRADAALYEAKDAGRNMVKYI